MKDIGGMQIIIFAEAQQLAVERSHLDRNLLFFFFFLPLNAYFS